MDNQQIEARKQRGLQIAKTTRIEKTKEGWKVPSQYGSGFYMVISNGFEAKCNCPDCQTRNCKCKHIFAVEFIVTEEVDNKGNVTVTQTVRKTYKQDWNAYNTAQQGEKKMLMQLLGDVTNNIPQQDYKFGRPTTPISDMIYTMIFKTYSTFSGRRFMSDMEIAQEKGYVSKKIPYNTMFDYFNKKELTSILSNIVTTTSLPLKSVENDFGVDSTGFGTNNFQRWFSFKHGREICSKKWVKCHFITGVKTNIIPSVSITTEYSNDCPEMKKLVNNTAEHFDMNEVSGDKAYSSRENHNMIANVGATPYIAFKKNATAKPNGSVAWKKMYHYFMLNNESYMQHYHKRSNAETTVHMIKSKFGDKVRSKKWTSQVNEVLCKVVCHNICVVIQEMQGLGISAEFGMDRGVCA